MTDINTEAEYLLEDVDCSQEGAHIAYTINALGGSASQVSEERPYFYKAGNTNLTEEECRILEDIKKAEQVGMESLKDNLKAAIKNKYPKEWVGWIEKFSHNKVVYYKEDNYFALSYTVDGNGVVILGNDEVEVDVQTIFVEEESGNIVKFANSISTKEQIKEAFGKLYKNKDKLSDSELSDVVGNVSKAFKEFFPEVEEEDIPSILKASEKSKTSDAKSGEDNIEDMPIGIKLDKKMKDNMPDTKDKEVVTPVDNSAELEALQKSVAEMSELIKASDKRAKDAEDRAEAIQKATKDKELKQAKADMNTLVKAWELDNTEEVVEALLKAGDSVVLIDVMESLHNKVEEVKKSFGESENGVDGDVDVSTSSVEKSKANVIAKLKARNEARANK